MSPRPTRTISTSASAAAPARPRVRPACRSARCSRPRAPTSRGTARGRCGGACWRRSCSACSRIPTGWPSSWACCGAIGAGESRRSCGAPGCCAALRDYGHWVGEDAAASRVAARTRDVTELLAEADLPLGSLPLTATYHDPCHLAHGQRVRSAPRALLGRIPDLRLVPLADSELCCGSAG